MILSAGKGTRLRPLTLTTPKPLVEVGGQPLIVWHIKALKQAGITDITINVSWLADKLLNAIGDGSQFGVTIHWSIEPEEPLETAGGIKLALATGKLKDQPFILVNGDVWTPFNFAQLSQLNLNDSQAYLLLTDQATHNPTGDFALENGKVKADGTPKYTFAGISVMSPRLLDTVKAGETAPLAPLLKQAMQAGLVMGDLLSDAWVDVGTLERLENLNQKLSANK
jgi:MurNAc alpha-1-phosphate uridylyltransferase